MPDKSLRSKLIRLAHANPKLREHLLPLVQVPLSPRTGRIQHAPRQLAKFLAIFTRNVDKKTSELSKVIKDLLRTLSEDDLGNFLSNAGLWTDAYEFKEALGDVTTFRKIIPRWERLAEVLTGFAPDEHHSARGHRIGSLDALVKSVRQHQGDLLRVRRLATDLDGVSASQFRDAVEYAEGTGAGKVPKLMGQVVTLSAQITHLLERVLPPLEEKQRAGLHWSDQEPQRPPSEDIETLYHASVGAAGLMSKGFRPGVHAPLGLGGSNEGLISFTSDLFIAKEIARSLKIAVMIAQGKVKATDIWEWARSENILERVQKSYAGMHGPTGYSLLHPDKALDKTAPHRVMQLYQSYLGQANGYDPVFMLDEKELMQQLKSKNYSHVGVIAAQVDMTHKSRVYVPGEREYRFAPEAVLSVDKLIK